MRIGVIGGGAAGMTAAITAARDGALVTILEAKDRLGQKILATGNGRCNLGNYEMDISKYYGKDLRIPKACLDKFGTSETIRFFRELGLLVKDRDGYLYPYCEQASAVLDVLRNEVASLGIETLCSHPVKEVSQNKSGGFWVDGLAFDRIIIACGGKASPKAGHEENGYGLAKKLGHRLIPVIPALTFLKCEGDYWKALAGVRCNAKVTLGDAVGRTLAEETGEVQLTEQGLSGIPCFQLSRVAGYAVQNKDKIIASVDFLPQMTNEDVNLFLTRRLPLRKNRTVESYFTGILNKKVMQVLIKMAGLRAGDAALDVSEKQLTKVMNLAKHFEVTVCGTGDFQHAQVCAGGIAFDQVNENLESKLVRGLYFAGEILDIDGKCGGYNLQWAWTSGYLAGKNAAGRTIRR